MKSSPQEEDKSSKTPNQQVLVMLFYPYTLAMITAGFTAFIILILGYSLHLAASVALGFFGFSSTILYFITKPATKPLNLQGLFLSITVLADIFAILSFGTLFLSFLG
ncbi:hypothetical protein AKJ36_00800 [candidate division MSBL1 archaeon SCGC-AAA259I07]|uniref:Uncharacterized protein n=2 Tax=candidate division MSBL1 TaxID=215777 RepID=A0A133U6S2_9EURY|nr:hypothetical protein AKJ61_01905 [candidate division MSBL1 archaeon SCGC-AAA259B11]KXA95369.1 hypothetical protein AKJ36_00800 [candidate division MSBL1 archaeon SCGC-AAA259I07]